MAIPEEDFDHKHYLLKVAAISTASAVFSQAGCSEVTHLIPPTYSQGHHQAACRLHVLHGGLGRSAYPVLVYGVQP